MMLQTQDEINAQHQKNLYFFQEHFPDIYNLLTKCPFKDYKLIYNVTNSDTITENNEQKKGFFNLQIIGQPDDNPSSFYYQQDPGIEAIQMMDTICNDQDFFTTKIINSEDNMMSIRIGEYEEAEAYIEKHQSAYERNEPFKVVCFGTGLGMHIDLVSTRLAHLKTLYILEPEEEIFKYSTFFIDYSKIAHGRKLFFSIGKSAIENSYDTFKQFQQIFVSYNFSTKFLFLKRNLREYIHQLTTEYLKSNLFELSFEHYVSVNKNTYLNLLQHKVIDFDRTKVDISKPVLLIMSGPSLINNLDFIAKAQHKFLLVAVGSSLYKLYQKGIVADICFTMDGKKRKIEEFTKVPQEYLAKVTFIASEITDVATTEYLQPMICFYKNKRTVGHYALGILSEWGFKNIYTIGNDVCVSESGREYIKDLPFKDKLSNTQEVNDTGYSYEKVMEVKGNFRPTVKSKMKFLSYISTYEYMKKYYLFDKNVYNLSDGAYIEGLVPLHCDDINLDDFPLFDKSQVFNFKLQLPAHEDVFSFDIDFTISRIKQLIEMSKAVKIEREFNFLAEYINYRDATFMNTFSTKVKPLIDASGILRYVLFTDNLVFPFLDNKNFSKEEFNHHLRELIGLVYKGLVSLLEEILASLYNAKSLYNKIKDEDVTINIALLQQSNDKEYLYSKYLLEQQNSKRSLINTIFPDKKQAKNVWQEVIKNRVKQRYTVALSSTLLYNEDLYSTIYKPYVDTNIPLFTNKEQSLALIDNNQCYGLTNKQLEQNKQFFNHDIAVSDHNNGKSLEDLQYILYGIPIIGEIPQNEQQVILIVTYRNNFLEHYQSILTQLEKNSQIKRIHFHILNTYYYEEPLDETLFTAYDLQVTISRQDKFVFFKHLYNYIYAINYHLVNALLQANNKHVITLDIQSLVLKDFSTITTIKKPVAFHYNIKDKKAMQQFVYYKNSKPTRTIVDFLYQNALINIYINAHYKELNKDLLLALQFYKEDIHILNKTYADDGLSENSKVWVQNLEKFNSRFENRQIIFNNKKSNIRELVSSAKMNKNNSDIMEKVDNGVINASMASEYNGFIEVAFCDDNRSYKLSMLLCLGDDEWLIRYIKNEHYDQHILKLWAMLCQDSNGFIVDLNAHNGLFAIIAHHYCKDTLSINTNAYQYSKTAMNLKSNGLPIDTNYLQKDTQESICFVDEQVSKYKEKISLIKVVLHDSNIQIVSKWLTAKITNCKLTVLLSFNKSVQKATFAKMIQAFKTMGYNIYCIDEYTQTLQPITTIDDIKVDKESFLWLTLQQPPHILSQLQVTNCIMDNEINSNITPVSKRVSNG